MTKDIEETSNKVKVRCSNCGTLNGEKVKFCAECGEPLLNEEKFKKEKTENIVQEIRKSSSEDTYEKLREYKKLLEDGTLTKEEYDTIKKELLN
jgi:rRNA maturation endonuclease Nob1